MITVDPKVILSPFKELLLALLVFVLVLTGYVTSRNITSFDSVWSIHTAMSLLREGNTDLNEYRDLIDRLDIQHATATIDNHLYTVYPVGTSVLAAPFLAGLDFIARAAYGIDLNQYIASTVPESLEMLIASIITALVAVVIYRIVRLRLPTLASLVLTFIFAFCTSAWSTASRALWQHGPSMLMLAIALYLLLMAQHRPAISQFASLPLAFAYVIRPTNSLSIALLSLYILLEYRRYFLRYLFWSLWVAIPFVMLNLSIYHSLLPTYYSWYQGFSTKTLIEALAGNILSPSRGLLIFSPVLIFSVVGAILNFKRRSWSKLDTALMGVVFLHWIAISIWPIWWGGWSVGPRLFSDMIPYFIYFLIPVFEMPSRFFVHGRVIVGGGLLATLAISVFIQFRGANAPEVLRWNTQPLDVDQYPGRVWDWQDSQFLRGLKWGTPIDLSISDIPVDQLARSTYFELGTNDFRVREFDVQNSLIAPQGSGWQIINHDQTIGKEFLHLFDGIAPRATARTAANQQIYDLYYFDLRTRMLADAQLSQQTAAWSESLTPNLSSVTPIRLPVRFGNTLDLIGFQIITSTQTPDLSILTYWQVRTQTDRSLQLFTHILSPIGQILAQQDRFDVAVSSWLPGDIMAQAIHLSLPSHVPLAWLEIGWYDQRSSQRLPVSINSQAIGDRLLLGQIQP